MGLSRFFEGRPDQVGAWQAERKQLLSDIADINSIKRDQFVETPSINEAQGMQPRGTQHIQQLCGTDDNPRTGMNTGDLQHRDPDTPLLGPLSASPRHACSVF